MEQAAELEPFLIAAAMRMIVITIIIILVIIIMMIMMILMIVVLLGQKYGHKYGASAAKYWYQYQIISVLNSIRISVGVRLVVQSCSHMYHSL